MVESCNSNARREGFENALQFDMDAVLMSRVLRPVSFGKEIERLGVLSAYFFLLTV